MTPAVATANPVPAQDADVLDALYALLRARRGADPETSYAARLLARGPDAILKKIGEEATEVVLAAKDAQAGHPGAAEQLVGELADLCFHALVLMAHQDLPPARVRAELARRQGVSGLAEKASRPQESRRPGSAGA